METKLSLRRKLPNAIVDHILTFITPRPGTGIERMGGYAAAGFYELSRPAPGDAADALARRWEHVLTCACEHGHIEITRRAIRAGAQNYGQGMMWAAAGPNLSLFVWMLMKHLSAVDVMDLDTWSADSCYHRAMINATRTYNYAAVTIIASVYPHYKYPEAVMWKAIDAAAGAEKIT
jgi:hypothetical protein